jgi:ankyrin repeat protein
MGGGLEAVKILLAAGADVNAKTDMQKTALHFAAEGGMVKITEILLAAKADPRAKDRDSRTPLEVAGENEVADLLRAYK